MSIGEVDTKGKARRLPIKADIRRALCFPGGSTLMVSHLNMGTSANPEELPKFCSSLGRTEHSLLSATVHNPTLGSKEVCSVPHEAVNQITAITEYSHPQGLVKDGFQVDGMYNLIICVCNMFTYSGMKNYCRMFFFKSPQGSECVRLLVRFLPQLSVDPLFKHTVSVKLIG